MKILGKKRSKYKKNKCYEIEDIITREIKDDKNYYLIKWKGYSIAECTWEPTSHLNNVITMVEQFENNFPDSINQKRLKDFEIECQRYKYLRYLQKKKMKLLKKQLKTSYSNKFIIPLDDEEKKEDGKENESESNINIIIGENENKTEDNCCNTNVVGKLIKPIMIG